jgi:N-acyl-L-homoserine lactone synthetase
MIRVITPESTGLFPREIASMHRLRYRVFKERLNWNVDTFDGMERDEFDDYAPTYLVSDGSEVHGAWRILPTMGPNMLADVFPQLLEGAPPPRDPEIWEASRFAVDTGEQDTDGLAALNRVTMELCCAIVEYGIASGISEFVTVYDIRVARLLNRIGHHPTWTSKPQRIGNTIAMAGRFDTNLEVLRKLRAIAGISAPVLTWSESRDAA